MKLYFVRHGDAIHEASSDHARPLSAEGVAEVGRVGRGLKRMRVEVDMLFCSPRVRAHQTAELLAEILGCRAQVNEAVNFDFSLDALKVLTADLANDACVMFVGHNPSMSDVARAVCGANISMKTGGVVATEVYTPAYMGGELLWYVTPKVFRE